MIAKLYVGWCIRIEEKDYTVVGSQKLRGSYRYLLRGNDGQVSSLRREDMLAWQSIGRLQVVG